MEKIYVIEDDENIRNLLQIALCGFKYEPHTFETAEEALEHIEADQPDLAIFDLMLPGMDGVTAIKRVRRLPVVSKIPILILTAKDKELDKVVGLDGGADDYMVKPFGVLELGARIRSLLRRGKLSTAQEAAAASQVTGTENSPASAEPGAAEAAGQTAAAETGDGSGPLAQSQEAVKQRRVLQYRGLELDERKHEVSKEGVLIELTNKEYKLLRYLMERPSFVATRDELLNSIWGYDYDGESRTVDMHIKSLRQKLGDEDGELIQTVRGVGYKLK